MKLGTFLTILILTLVCLGFLINDGIHTHSELAAAHDAVVTLQKENSGLAQQAAQQEKEIEDLQISYNSLEEHNKVLTGHNTELDSQIQMLSTDLSNLRTENETLRQISAQLASNTNSSLVKAVLALAFLISPSTGKTILAAGFLPIFLFGSGILGYGLYSYRQKKTRLNTYMISVSKQELDAVIRHRRSK